MRWRTFTVPVLAWTLGSATIYAFLHWCFVLKLRVLEPPELVVDVLVPLLVSGFVFLGPLRKRVALISVGRWPNFLYWALVLSHFGLLALPQVGLRDFLFGLVTVSDIRELAQLPRVPRFVRVDEFVIEKKQCGTDFMLKNTSRTGHTRLMLFVACPLVGGRPLRSELWLGFARSETVERRELEESGSWTLRRMREQAWVALEHEIPAKVSYLERVGRNRDRQAFAKAASLASSTPSNDRTYLLSHTEPFQRPGKHAMIAATCGGLLLLGLAFFMPLADEETWSARHHRKLTRDGELSGNAGLGVLLPHAGLWATPILLDLVVAAFVVMSFAGVDLMNPAIDDLIRWGGNTPGHLADNGYWRLVTSIFVHAGLVHVAMNGAMLLFLGGQLELEVGPLPTLATFLGGGVLAALASANFNQATVSVGASGAVLALCGSLIVLTVMRRHKGSLTGLLVLAIVNILYGLTAGIDFWAHVGGFSAGLAFGALLVGVRKAEQ